MAEGPAFSEGAAFGGEPLDAFLFKPVVCRTVGGWHTSTLDRKVAEGKFPKADAFVEGRPAWRASTVARWQREQEQKAAPPKAPSTKTTNGRDAYWRAVKAGLKPHPRTIGRRKREAERAAQERKS